MPTEEVLSLVKISPKLIDRLHTLLVGLVSRFLSYEIIRLLSYLS